jgi:hypothetical protein
MPDKIEDYYNNVKFSEKLRKGEGKSTFFQVSCHRIVAGYTEILLVINSIRIN